MDDHNDAPLELTSDGELREDALFEWDGGEWKTIKTETQPLTSSAVLLALFMLSPVIVLFLWVCFGPLEEGGRSPSGNYAPNAFQLLATQTAILGTATARAWHATSVPASVPQATERPATASCDTLPSGRVYAFTYRNAIYAQSLDDTTVHCRLFYSLLPAQQPQLGTNDDFYYLSEGHIYYRTIEQSESVIVEVSDGEVDSFALSPDGHQLLYTQEGQLSLYDVDTETNQLFANLAEIGDVSHPVWSSDGSEIAFASDWQIYRMSLEDGNPVVVYEELSRQWVVTELGWSPDDTQIAATMNASYNSRFGLLTVNRDGTNSYLMTIARMDLNNRPVWLDSDHIAILQFRDDFYDTVIEIYNSTGGVSDILRIPAP